MIEGFIDELARAAGRDPYQFRRAMLQHDTEGARRQLGVLDFLAEKANWQHRQPGHALRDLGILAPSAAISAPSSRPRSQGNVVTVHRVIQAIDCGIAVHPDNIIAQMEGGMAFGLTAVLRGKITLQQRGGHADQLQRLPRCSPCSKCRKVESYIIPSTAAPGGVGEPGTGPIAPALANAIYARIRHAAAVVAAVGASALLQSCENLTMFVLNINGSQHSVDVEADTPLLWALAR